jgi:hypothetical protein
MTSAEQAETADCEDTDPEHANLISIPVTEQDQDTPGARTATNSRKDAYNTYQGAGCERTLSALSGVANPYSAAGLTRMQFH